MVCSAWLLVVGGQVQGSRLCAQEEGCCTTTSNQALHNIGGNNTYILELLMMGL
jgi:hypothetical protein